MSVAFSKDDSAIIKEKLDVGHIEPTSENQLISRYQLSGCCEWIQQFHYQIVALQFPDELLVDAAPIAIYLQNHTESQVFVLADTSYGSCCVDEVAAEHITADCIIHFGHSCLSPTSRLPVRLVFVDQPLDVSVAAEAVFPVLPRDRTVVLFADVKYQHALAELCGRLLERLPSVVAAEPAPPSPSGPGDSFRLLNRLMPLSEEQLRQATVLFVGAEGRTLTCLAMALGDTPLLAWDPAAGGEPREQGPAASRAVRRRYYMVERTKDAARVGLLVGTLAVRRYREALARLKRLLRAAGKRCYTLVCGKVNVAKLANFPELDVLVLVSCPESALVESRDFLQPLVTPYEVELACNPDLAWSERYVAEFGRLLPGGDRHVPLPEAAPPAAPDVSLVTGRLRLGGPTEPTSEPAPADGQLQLRPELELAAHRGGAGQLLVERGWRGLEPRPGDTPVSAAVQGQRGRAVGYEQEGEL